VLGLLHALVDCACGFILFRDLASAGLPQATVVSIVVLYDGLAFAGQVPLGLILDRAGSYVSALRIAAVAAGVSLVVAPHAVVPALVLIGLANAGYHLGAGSVVLRTSGNRATAAGIFVGPGAVGLAAGIWLGSQQVSARWVLAVLLALAAIALPVRDAVAPTRLPAPRERALATRVALLLLVSIVVRALVGDSVVLAYRPVAPSVVLWLAFAATAGKMLGGLLGDRLGWLRVSVVALVLSSPLTSLLVGTEALAIAGMLLFQMTMPMTLKAMHHLLPGRPALAFGLPCLGLFVGALPGLYGLRVLTSPWLVLATVIAAALLVGLALLLLPTTGSDGGPSVHRVHDHPDAERSRVGGE
jgi:FSR family fosmidomycin resistance protein-like MFS transporter